MSDINITKFLRDLEDENLRSFVLCPECGQILTTLHDYRTVQVKHYTCGQAASPNFDPEKTVQVLGLQSQGYRGAFPGKQALFHLERD